MPKTTGVADAEGLGINVPGAHAIRNYLIFAILTIGAICTAAWFYAKQAAKQKHRLSGSMAEDSCSLTGSLIALPEISEASGLALSRRTPGILWTHNDDAAVLYAIDVLGKSKGRVDVSQAPIQDFEDLAIGPCDSKTCLFVGDIGDNRANRDHISVYRVPEPLPTDAATEPAVAFHATYPDGPQDAEALFVTKEGGVYIVTKGNGGPISLYRFPQPLRPGATVRLELVATLLPGSATRSDRVTGAGMSPDGKWVVLRTHDAVLFYETEPLVSGKPKQPLRYSVSWLNQTQAEGVALGDEGALFLIGEGGAPDSPGSLAHGVCKLPIGSM